MPEISRFLGIIVAMFYQDHAPPHFHAKYGEYEVTVTIEDGLVSGEFPKRALSHVLEWLELHKPELLEDWELAKQRKPLNKVNPLE
jgi:phosphatidylserine/phosphatidylglycerophosphate/cardiolipin synthase-like enzyme